MPNIDVRPEVAAFALLMEKRLRENDHKPGWKNDSPEALMERLYEEAEELAKPAEYFWKEEVADESADVANFAMMIADVTGALKPEPPPPAPSDAEEVVEQIQREAVHFDKASGSRFLHDADAVPIVASALSSRAREELDAAIRACEEVDTGDGMCGAAAEETKQEIIAALRALRAKVGP